MYLQALVDYIYNSMRHSSDFAAAHVIKAYPYAMKPTRLDKAIITISPSGIDAEMMQIGDTALYGDFSVDIDVFIPHEMGSPCTSGLMSAVVEHMAALSPSAIKVSGVSSYNKIGCFTAKCTATFTARV